MTTAQKRAKFIKEYPERLADINEAIELGEYRNVDEMGNYAQIDTYAKEYIITLLCDELIRLTNEENND
jgi:hypothetical protein